MNLRDVRDKQKDSLEIHPVSSNRLNPLWQLELRNYDVIKQV